MALINIHADMRSVAKALNRIAHALEKIATVYMGIDLSERTEPVERTAAEEVSYTSDRQEVRKEVSEKLNIAMEPEDETVQP